MVETGITTESKGRKIMASSVLESVNDPFQVGEMASIVIGSDRHAYEIVARYPGRIVMRRLRAFLINHMDSDEQDKLIAYHGGFMAHVSGNQRYRYESNADGVQVVANKMRKPVKVSIGRGHDGYEQYEYRVGFKVNGWNVIPGAHEKYDYNF